MARKKKITHTTLRNGSLFCLHCGGEKKLVMPTPIPDLTKEFAKFNKLHGDCKPEWEPPKPDMSLGQYDRETWWIRHGERGISSETMFEKLTGRIIKESAWGPLPPADPSDFRRCHLLLEAVPELRAKMDGLREISPVWSRLVDNWDKLTGMLKEQMETKKANGMYEFMQSLEC
jgi:hypothetical protein